jgi:hypothetical protein
MTNVLYALLGGALVVFGILAAAVADRVRGIKAPITRERSSVAKERLPAAVAIPTRDTGPRAAQEPTMAALMEQDVVAALVASGYKRAVAADAARGCATADRLTIESWTAAALRRAGKGAPS